MEERAHADHPENEESKEELRVLARLIGEGGESPPREATEGEAAPPSPPAAANAKDERAPQPPRLVARRFEIRNPLGEGPHGRVFLVRDHDHQGREVALKILSAGLTRRPDFSARLREHLETARALQHDAINRSRDGGRTELGLFYLASDLVRGESLRALLDRKGALRPRHALEIVRQVLAGLEHAHGAGIAHGGLGPENVHLEERVPWTEENPFGVRVRLLDLGLAGLLHGEGDEDRSPPDPEGDLLDVGRILVELLLGTKPPTGPQDWAGAAAVPGTARLSRRARGLVDRALAPDPAARYASARTFRVAIETVPELTPEVAHRRHVSLLYTAILLLVVAALLPWLRGGGQAPAPVRAEGPETDEALQTALRELEEARQANVEQAGRLAALDEEMTGLRSTQARWRERAETAEGARVGLEDSVRKAEEERGLLEAQLRTARELARDLEATRLATLRSGDPAFVLAAGFDAILARAETGEGLEARALLLSLDEEPVLAGEPIAGRELLDAFTAAALGLDRAELLEDDLEAAEALGEVTTLVEEARVLRRDFAVAAAEWLRAPEEDGGVPDRLGVLDRVLGVQRLALAEASGALSVRLEARWTRLLAEVPDRPPREALVLAHWFDDGRLEAFLARYVLHVQRMAEAEGRLDPVGLRGVESLGAWAVVVRESPELAATHLGREVLLFHYARRWYDTPDPAEGAPPGGVVFQGPEEGEAPAGWRAELAGRAALVAPDSPFPGPPGAFAVYRTLTAEGSTNWQTQRIESDPEPPVDASASWLVRQRFFDAAGVERSERRFRIVRRGKRFFEEDLKSIEVLDLGRLDPGIRPGAWSPPMTVDVPAGIPVGSEAIVAFRKRLAEGTAWPCLVRSEGTRSSWYSPTLGLVRHEDPGRITRELIFLDTPD